MLVIFFFFFFFFFFLTNFVQDMSASDRLSTIKGHLSASHPQGLLAGEVAIITGSG